MKPNHPEVDECAARDPNKASWRHDGEVEYELDQSAGLVIVESETMALVYELMYRSMVRAGWDIAIDNAEWRKGITDNLNRRFVLFLENDFDLDTFLGHGLSGILLDEFLAELKDGLRHTSLFWEDVIGITIIPGTTKVRLHFSTEGLSNGGIAS